MALSKKEREEMREQSKTQTHSSETSKHSASNNRKSFFLYSFLSVLAVVLVIFAGFGIVSAGKPGILDEFAKCLAENDAVVYGASFCPYSDAQKDMFGKSKKHLDYRDYSENDDVSITPTWYINDEKIENVQSLEKLSQLTGCQLPGRG